MLIFPFLIVHNNWYKFFLKSLSHFYEYSFSFVFVASYSLDFMLIEMYI